MNVYSLYFSPTGGTKKVMDILAGEWMTKVELDLSLPKQRYDVYRFERGDVCLIGVPVYGGRVPDVALEHLRQMKADHAAAILVAVYGNRDYDDALLELRKAAEGCGFRVVAAIGAVAEHSIMRQFASGRPDGQDEKELKEFVGKIREKLNAPKTWRDFFVPGRYPYQEYNGVPFKPAAQKECKGCGACAGRCPVGAIPAGDPSKTDENKCISCMRCIAVCPSGARKLNQAMLFAASLKMRKACSGRKVPELFV